jgi:predicted transcriptional regulator
MNPQKQLIKTIAKDLETVDKKREALSHTLACAIRDFRKSLDVSGRELSRRLEISAQYLCDVELGRRMVSKNPLQKILSL